MNNQNECTFCKIINNQIYSEKIFENEHVISFLDILPVAPGHLLVVPKRHCQHLQDMENEDLLILMDAVKKNILSLMSLSNVQGYNLIINSGSTAGQVIPHLHIHLIPRRQGDNLKSWPGTSYREGEAEIIAQKLRDNLL